MHKDTMHRGQGKDARALRTKNAQGHNAYRGQGKDARALRRKNAQGHNAHRGQGQGRNAHRGDKDISDAGAGSDPFCF